MTISITTVTAIALGSLKNSIYRVLGPTTTGYGAGLVSRDVAAGSLITTSSFYTLVDDLRRCWIHQTGSLEGFLATADLPQAGEKVSETFLNTLTALTATIALNAYTTTASQLTLDSLASSTSTIYRGNALTYRVDYTFRDRADANYFFNLGGNIGAGLSTKVGAYSGDTGTWAVFINWADSKINSFNYSRNQWVTPSSINTSYNSGTNTVSLGIFPKNNTIANNTVTVVVTVTNLTMVVPVVTIPTTATSRLTYSTLGPVIDGQYQGVASPIPQASIITSFGSGQIPPIVPVKILTVSQPTDFTFPSDSNSYSQTITIRNTGNRACIVDSIVYPELSFITTDITYPGGIAPPWTIDPNATHTFDVRYFGLAGLAAGAYAGYFSVYSDAIVSPVTVNTQLTVTAPVFDFFLDPVTWDYTYTHRDSRSVTQLVKIGGKGDFTTVNYVTDANFSARGFSINDSSTYVGFDFTFIPPPGLANGTYSTTVRVVVNGVTHSFTATITLAVPAAPVNRHLGDWVSALQKDNAVIGASYDIINDVRYVTLGFGMGADGSGNVVDTLGANVNVTNLGIGANADANFALGPVLYPGPSNPVYSDFLKPSPTGYGVWVNDSGWSPVSVFVPRTYTISSQSPGTHTYTFAADNQAYFTIDGILIGDLRNNSITLTPYQDSFYLSAGNHTLTVYFYNTDVGYYDSTNNPGSMALTIVDPYGRSIWDSNQPVRTAYTAYQYWNEVCRIPLYDSTATDAIYYSKDYLIKNLSPLNGYSYGSYFGYTGSVQEGSMFTVIQDPYNNITVALNAKSDREVADKTTNYASYLMYYYSDVLGSDRLTQLESNPGAGNSTRWFTGFDKNGAVTTLLLTQPPAPYVPPAAGGGGGGCPDPAVPITVSETGYTCLASELTVGDTVWTRHETTGVFDNYPITFVETEQQPKVKIFFDDDSNMIVSDTHKFLMWNLVWKQIFQLLPGDVIKGLDVNKTIVDIEPFGVGPVVKITVDQAHTYIAGGLVSHNVKIVADTNEVIQ
jgi:hypothetical protein